MLPRAEAMLPRQLTMPMHAALTDAEVDRSVEALREILR